MSASHVRVALRLDRGRDIAGVGALEEDAGLVGDHRVEIAAVVQDDRRLAERGRLERREAVVLVGRRDQRRAVAIEPAQLFVADPAGERDPVARRGQRFESTALRALTHDDEPRARHPQHRLDDRVDVLVRQQPGHAKKEAGLDAVERLLRAAGQQRGRRRQDLGLDAVDAGGSRRGSRSNWPGSDEPSGPRAGPSEPSPTAAAPSATVAGARRSRAEVDSGRFAPR